MGRKRAVRHAAIILLGLMVALIARGVTAIDDDAPEEEDDGGFDQDALSSEQMRAMHTKIDKNTDGRMSLEEILQFSQEMRATIARKDISTIMDELDADKDGKMSLDELLKDMEQWGEEDEQDRMEATRRKELETAKFHAADTNSDGYLGSEELPALFYPETSERVLELTAGATMKQKDTDGDGALTPKEFWEGDAVDGEELAISDEEQADFAKLDVDSSGTLSIEELKAWESGMFHTEEAMKKLFEIADQDSDLHITANELDDAREQIAGSDAQYHLMEWVEHNEL